VSLVAGHRLSNSEYELENYSMMPQMSYRRVDDSIRGTVLTFYDCTIILVDLFLLSFPLRRYYRVHTARCNSNSLPGVRERNWQVVALPTD